MPASNFNLGRDCSIVLIGPYGRVNMQSVKDFTAKQMTHAVRINPLNGAPLGADVPNGWQGSFSIDRANSALDDLTASIEAAFWAGGYLANSTLTQYINEVGGNTTSYNFTGVSLVLGDAGNWTAEKEVNQKMEFFASQRTKLS